MSHTLEECQFEGGKHTSKEAIKYPFEGGKHTNKEAIKTLEALLNKE